MSTRHLLTPVVVTEGGQRRLRRDPDAINYRFQDPASQSALGRLSVSIAGEMRVELASYSVAPAGSDPFIVNLFVMTRQPDRFADLLASFRSEA